MLISPTARQDELLTLPDDAPRTRITAGIGTARQKSWCLRRSVTLIGSGRRAHVVLRGQEVARVHCAIINTGSVVLLKDLHTKSGTLCNNKRIDLTVLSDGDLVQIGSTPIQVAVQTFRTTAQCAAAANADPLRLGAQARLHRPGVSAGWLIDESCAVIGRAAGVAVRLDHESVSDVHALLFDLNAETVLFDLASESGTFRNGQPVGLTRIDPGDCLRVGSFELTVVCPNDEAIEPAAEAVELALMADDLRSSWHQLNDWQASSSEQPEPARDSGRELADRAAGLDRLEARLRGRLHDLTGHQEDLAAREKKLRGQRQAWETAQKKLSDRTAELEKLQAGLALRERQLAARERRIESRPAVASSPGLAAQLPLVSEDLGALPWCQSL